VSGETLGGLREEKTRQAGQIVCPTRSRSALTFRDAGKERIGKNIKAPLLGILPFREQGA